MVKISVIIPVYNSVQYLDNCMQSLLQQTFKEFEVWLVDDGSTDGSSELCDKWAQRDSRIHTIHTENGGAAHARWLGVEHIAGEWVFFADSDDTLPIDALARLFQVAIKNDTEIVVGFCRKSSKWKKHTLSCIEYRKKLIQGRHNIGTLWGKLFHRKLFESGLPVIPRSIVMGEDMLINIYLAFMTEKKVYLVQGKSVYNYIQREAGLSKNFELTPEYEFDFHIERLKVIPNGEHSRYMHTMIHRRLRMLKRLLIKGCREHTVRTLGETPFVREILSDIQENGFCFWYYPNIFVWRFLKRISGK